MEKSKSRKVFDVSAFLALFGRFFVLFDFSGCLALSDFWFFSAVPLFDDFSLVLALFGFWVFLHFSDFSCFSAFRLLLFGFSCTF